MWGEAYLFLLISHCYTTLDALSHRDNIAKVRPFCKRALVQFSPFWSFITFLKRYLAIPLVLLINTPNESWHETVFGQ
jgi:hypothetical protein